MKRTHRYAAWLGALLASACTATNPEPETARAVAPRADPQPTSTAWLYVTGPVRGGPSAECAAVLEAVRAEKSCQQGLCKYAEELANDWVAVCAKGSPDAKTEVQQLAAGYSEVSTSTEQACEVEARNLIRQGCPDDSTCAETGQSWAGRCTDWGSPLVLRMLSVRIERATGQTVKLDARSCDSLASQIDEALACSDVVKCEALSEPTAAYLERCVRDDGRVSMESGLRILAAKAAMRQQLAPLPLADTVLENPGRSLPLASGRGAVVRVGWSTPTSYEEYRVALAAAEGEDVMVARVFLDDAGRSTLRLGSFSLDADETLASRFPSLTVVGEEAKQEGKLLTVVRDRLAKAAQSASPQRAAALLVDALVEASPYVASSSELQAEFSRLDQQLAPVFRWIGQRKGEKLSTIWQRDVLIPALRRSRALLAADIDQEGTVAIGELTPAAAVELRTLMPQCAAAYDEGLSYVEKAMANATLTSQQEQELTAGVSGQVERCGQALSSLHETEESLFVCSFGQGACDEDVLESTLVKLDETKEWLRQARLNAKVAVAMLPGPARARTAEALRDRCLEN